MASERAEGRVALTDPRSDRERKTEITLAVGYAALAVAVVLARRNPATGHEVSIYAATPTGVWVGLGLALMLALAVALFARAAWLRSLAIALALLSGVVFVSLPVIRGYLFYGLYDSLTHLGWANDIASGALEPTGLMYPGIHLVSLFIATVTGFETSTAMLLMVVCMLAVFFVFVPLCVRAIVPGRPALAVGAFSALLLLPITQMSTHMNAHTMSQAILFSTLLVFLLVRFLATPRDSPALRPLSILLALVAAVTVVFHPQLAIHLLVALVGICSFQFLYRVVTSDRPLHTYPTVYSHTVFLLGVFVLWSANHDLFSGIATQAITSAIAFVLGEGTQQAGASIASQGSSLLAIGGSIGLVFFKLFFVSLVFCFLSLGVFLATFSSWGRRTGFTSTQIQYLSAGLGALFPVFVFYYIGTLSEMYFRVFGLMMLFVTVLGAVAITLLTRGLAERFSERSVNPVVVGVFVLLLVLALAAAFPSPYVYQQSPHVTHQQMHGHALAFENQEGDTRFAGVRQGPYRYVDAIEGGGRTSEHSEQVPAERMHDGLPSYFEGDRYVIVTEIDEQREVEAYRELRYAEEDLVAIEAQEGVHNVQSNGEFDLYMVQNQSSANGAA
ncbi:hypothetical protein [Halalkalicoccus jeotgali]|uniref:Glycosyltransferase RgtA/B/C/D-like domain-containing protein n=1 Tax=Halalkalicoccus jeotgali (strain DSM 18796 / CECT 7217 / JCM 14584 / KCTC 4019 / B3) TaxID=795797 RepID=D8J489_HALJB|nr:hypothetical protein [Halalkalicoccus jeotgali]ADJ15481.1 hypothetical protein HacjB3_10490 [Halalkalicoccus jeotgali B3]ELY36110.1 hypothetical protein C497_12177 [Halalkalicoccus jeotgali B3]